MPDLQPPIDHRQGLVRDLELKLLFLYGRHDAKPTTITFDVRKMPVFPDGLRFNMVFTSRT